MTYFSDHAKALAKRLRQSLKQRDIDLSHGQCLEIISELTGEISWNHLSAKLNTNRDRDSLPYGWFAHGEYLSTCYQFDFEKAPRTVSIECEKQRPRTYATLMQFFSADRFKDTTLRFSGQIKTEDADSASLWMRADGAERERLAFDNMQTPEPDRSIKGTADWQDVAIELFIPNETEKIFFGLLLSGKGRASFRNLQMIAQNDKALPLDYDDTDSLYPVNLGMFASQTM
ncbi:hypothetical protein MXMO3_02255 [Maritalea myrionectae]|uniref:Glyoxalase-related protein domain-containing protein n=1 Tax=Maritalea myrionectae TaxID=454601 RepID=A0A2R4MFW4_9HYPH|nr:glyoxalase superfamily protein [Maritalea myrionectae]AVX04769.1 hypothetical protein MXMO3_02255 [Maritalea myrionectae]